jgi:hypothetical protein
MVSIQNPRNPSHQMTATPKRPVWSAVPSPCKARPRPAESSRRRMATTPAPAMGAPRGLAATRSAVMAR